MSFRDNLKIFREQAGYTQAKEFAQDLGIPYTRYMAYENKGSFPNEPTLVAIAKALNVSVDELLGVPSKSAFFKCKKIVEKAGFFVEQRNNHVGVYWNCGKELDDDIDGTFFLTEKDFITCVERIVKTYQDITQDVLNHEMHRVFQDTQNEIPNDKSVTELLDNK